MHREWIDQAAHAQGRLQGWDPRFKVGALLFTLFALSLTTQDLGARSVARVLLVGLGAPLAAGYAGIPLGRWFLRSLVVFPFVGFVALSVAIELRAGTVAGESAINFGAWSIGWAPDGPERALLLLARAWVSVAWTLVIVSTTPLPSILAALERFRVPRGLLAATSLVYRYLWVLTQETRRLLLARRLRGSGAPWRSGAAILSTLFSRSLARAERIEIALRLRGTDGFPVGATLSWRGGDTVRLMGFILIGGIAWWGTRVGFPIVPVPGG